jgi:UDP-2,3-diacylglucosamine pyrophosphatase LpxH
MKAFLISDTHFGTRPIDSDKWLSMMENYFYDFFIPLIKEKYEEGDVLIHLGDLYDNRSQIPINVLNSVDKIISELSDILPIHLLIGNHDIYNKSTNDVNSPKSLRWIPNVNIYEKTQTIELGGKNLTMMPWVERKVDQVKLLKEHSADYLFCHSDLNGCRMHLSSVAWKNKNKIDIESFASYEKVFSGHIHIRQENKNFKFIGSPYHLDRNDIGDQKGVYILDIESGDEEFVPNEISPQFKKIQIIKEEDISKIDIKDSKKNYIDLSISNTLLINNRKLRRKIEQFLEEGSFARVDYINDMVSKEEDDKDNVNENKSEDIDLDMDLESIDFDDFGKIIKKYIKSQKWKSEDVKDGVLKEYEEIINTYKDQY